MKRFLIAFAALCVLGLSISGLVLVTRLQQQRAAERRFVQAGPADLAREEAAARCEGIPLTAQQLQQPLPPAGQNAAPLYTKLTKLLHDKPLGLPKYAEGMDAFHSYTPAQIAAVRQNLAARQDVMTLVHEAADKPKCVFVRDWNQGVTLDFPELQPMREAARLLKTESYLLARDGHYKEAVACQAKGFRVAEHAESDHVVLSHLVGIACESLTLNGMQSISALAGPNAAAEVAVQQAVAVKQPHLSLRDAMAGETGFDCAAFHAMHQAENNGINAVFTAGGFADEDKLHEVQVTSGKKPHLHNLIDAWQAEFLAQMRPLVAASDQPPSARKAAYEAAALQADRDSRRPDVLAFLFADNLVPVFTKIDLNDTRTQARVAVTLAAAAVLAQRAKSGTFPASLPPGFADPFTSKPLLYRREAGGFVVYSAGPTGTFDGGKSGIKPPAQESVFWYPAVPLPAEPK